MSYSELRKGRHSEAGQVYFVTTVTAGRKPLFADFSCARQLIPEMRSLHDEACVDSLAWVVMPDHLHWLFQLGERMDLPNVMKRFKAHSARRINAWLDQRGSVWQKAYYDHALRKEEDLRKVARYIVANPLRAKLVEHLGDYPLWDAAWL